MSASVLATAALREVGDYIEAQMKARGIGARDLARSQALADEICKRCGCEGAITVDRSRNGSDVAFKIGDPLQAIMLASRLSAEK